MTFNMLNQTYMWNGPVIGWASNNDGDGQYGMADGLAVGYYLAYDGMLTLMDIDSGGFADVYQAYGLMPDFDATADNLLVVEAIGSIVNFWVEEVGDSSNTTGVQSFDLSNISGYSRDGDYIHIGQYGGGVEDVRVYIYE